jgi:hypothetical protein
MAFEDIDFLGTASVLTVTVPVLGVRVAARSVGQKGGGLARFIRVTIGAKIASAIGLKNDLHQLKVAFGTGPDAGKIAVWPASEGGQFRAKRDKQNRYAFTINAQTADGMFALQFPAFVCDGLAPIRPHEGSPVKLVFEASKLMLDAD